MKPLKGIKFVCIKSSLQFMIFTVFEKFQDISKFLL